MSTLQKPGETPKTPGKKIEVDPGGKPVSPPHEIVMPPGHKPLPPTEKPGQKWADPPKKKWQSPRRACDVGLTFGTDRTTKGAYDRQGRQSAPRT